MKDFLTAIGLMFVIEGVSYALFPEGMKRMMLQALSVPIQQIRVFALAVAVFGFLVVAVIRGY